MLLYPVRVFTLMFTVQGEPCTNDDVVCANLNTDTFSILCHQDNPFLYSYVLNGNRSYLCVKVLFSDMCIEHVMTT